ncbi:MAG: dienelactone hydrolase family protein [Acidimicrobiia bacterium]
MTSLIPDVGLVATPRGGGPFPGVVLLSEAWGLDREVKRLAILLAEAGFLTAAPDLVSARGATSAAIEALRGDGGVYSQVRDTIDWLVSRAPHVGVVGLSMGATIALRLAPEGPFRAAAAFYGFVPKTADWTRSCPIVGSFGGRDRLVRHRGLELRHALDLAGIANDIKCYEHSRHSFLTESKVGWQSVLLGLRHDPVAAADAWQRTVRFLHHHLQSIPA